MRLDGPLGANPRGGVCVLRWDNSYSSLRSKRLQFCLAVVPAARMEEAMRFASAHTPAWSTKGMLARRGSLSGEHQRSSVSGEL